jgi:hypothetical protein
MGIWHIYSDGTRADIPFETDEDKGDAWNSVAICAEMTGVRVWVATVNDTHLHSLVEGEELNAEQDRLELQRRLNRQFPGQNIFFVCDLVEKREEILSKFMYVYRNCLDFYRKLPGEYAWGCGNIYFSENRHFFEGKRLDSLSLREQYAMFKTKRRLPAAWRVDASGRILPESFIVYETVEQFFGSVRAYIAFLYVRKEDEAAMKQQIHNRYLEMRTIQDLRRLGNQYCVNACGRTLSGATLEIRLKVATRMLREGLAGRTPSLAKALLLKPDDLRFLV